MRVNLSKTDLEFVDGFFKKHKIKENLGNHLLFGSFISDYKQFQKAGLLTKKKMTDK